MKIAILTQPLRTNYGGILQAYALQTVLQRRGHEVVVINREYKTYETFGKSNLPSPGLLARRVLSFVKTFFKRIVLRQKGNVLMNPLSPFYHTRWTGYDVLPFVYKKIRRSKPIRFSDVLFRYIKHGGFHCVIVGSDQVWRPKYSPDIMDYFLKGLDWSHDIKRIAYAASFGTDSCEFTVEEISECACLLKNFDAVSVREESGVELCKKLFDVTATHLLDPTMLLDKKDYINLALSNETITSSGDLLVYVLDPSDKSDSIIDNLVQSGYYPNKASLTVNFTEGNHRLKQMSVEQWLRGFYEAKLVVTDSFHACVFSIIFQKPFIVIGNNERGIARIESLLKMFNLQKRQVFSLQDFENRKDELVASLDDNAIMQDLSRFRVDSIEFLSKWC